MIIWQVPTLLIVSLGGFLPSICSLLVFLGFVQYRSNMPSLSHFFLDRSKDAKSTELLRRKRSQFLLSIFL